MSQQQQSIAQVIMANIPAEKREEVEKTLQQAKPKLWHGHKVTISYVSPEITVSTILRFEKVTAKDIERKVKAQISHRHISGVPVRYGTTPYHKGWFDASSNEYDEKEVKHYQIKDGQEVEVTPFPRTEKIEIKKLLPLTSLDEFLPDSIYQAWSTSELLSFAEYLHKTDQMAVGRYSFGRGWKEYHTLMYPIFQEGKWLMVMVMTQKRLEFTRWMPVDAVVHVTNRISVAESFLQEI